MARSITTRLLASYLCLVILLGVAWLVALFDGSTLRARYQHTVQTVDALSNAEAVLVKLMDDQETGLRGYLLTGNAVFLQPYTEARRLLPSLRRQATALTTQEPGTQPLLRAQYRRASAWERWAAPLASHAPDGDVRDSPPLIAQQLQGKALFDAYRAAASRVAQYLDRARQHDLDAGEQVLVSMNALFALVMVSTVSLGLLLAWRTTRAVARPLARMGEAAQVIGRGALTHPIEVAGAREFTQLARTMDWMRRQLLQQHEALQESEGRFRATFEQAAVGIAHVGLDGRWLRVNHTLCDMLGYTQEELLQSNYQDITHPDDRDSGFVNVHRLVAGEAQTHAREKRFVRKDGSPLWIKVTVSLAHAPSGAAAYLISVIEDISERKRAEAAVQHQALHDALTGLPNRTLFHERLTQALQVAQRTDAPLALLLLDLNRFKEVNDTLGHHCGDLLLQQVAARLRATLRDADTIARLGGDEFVVLLPATNAAGAARVADKIRAALTAPCEMEGRPLDLSASIGIALAPDHGHDPSTLLRRADIAMYVAKRTGSGHAFYTAEQDDHSPDRLLLIASLRNAIAHDELVLDHQPRT